MFPPTDRAGAWLGVTARATAAFAAGLCVLVLGWLLAGASPGLQVLGLARLATDPGWRPTANAAGAFSLVPAAFGSVLVALLATLLAVPLGIATSIGAVLVLPRPVARTLDVAMSVLAGLPSVVLGLWGLTTLVPLVARLRPPGTSMLAAALTLGVMCLPTMHITAAAALRSTPREAVDAALAMGLTRWAILRTAIAPSAGAGVLVGAALALTRALGETMVVVMVAGNVAAVPGSLLDPVRTLTANIALEMSYAQGVHRSILYASGALLLLLVTILVLLSRTAARSRTHA